MIAFDRPNEFVRSAQQCEASCMIRTLSSRKSLLCKYHFIQYAAAMLHGHTVHATSLGGAETLKVCCTLRTPTRQAAQLELGDRSGRSIPSGSGLEDLVSFHETWWVCLAHSGVIRTVSTVRHFTAPSFARVPKYGRDHTLLRRRLRRASRFSAWFQPCDLTNFD